jgi:glycosyltransferase involved in cell wall biosynthesis
MLDARRAFARSFDEPYDVINLHFAMNALPLIPFIKHRTPRVVTFHGPWSAESRAEGGGAISVAIKGALERFVYQRSDLFIVLSGAFKDILAEYGIERDRIHVIPMGIDCDFFRPAVEPARVRRDFGWPSESIIFFTARRLVNRVGLLELIEAATILRRSHSNFSIKIAGKGPLRAELANAIDANKLGDCIELLGFISEEELVRAYQASNATILPTQSLEGFGTIISESLACGTPVIVTPVGGMPEAVTPLSGELITRSIKPEDIAERMDALIRGTLSVPDAAECRAYAVEQFDWNVVIERVRAVFARASVRARAPGAI